MINVFSALDILCYRSVTDSWHVGISYNLFVAPLYKYAVHHQLQAISANSIFYSSAFTWYQSRFSSLPINLLLPYLSTGNHHKTSCLAAPFSAFFVTAKSSHSHHSISYPAVLFSAIFIIIKSSHIHHNDQHWNLIKSGSYSRKPLKPIFHTSFRPPRFGIDFQTFKWR